MGRPKIGVTTKNLFAVKKYFKNALQDGRLWDASNAIDDETIANAQQGLSTIFSMGHKIDNSSKASVAEHNAKLCALLQGWTDSYVPKEKWERCLKTLRQQARHKKYQMRRLDLPQEIYISVKELAGRLQFSLAETIQAVVKLELDRMYAKDEKQGGHQ